MSSMFSEKTISTIKNIRKGFLWTAVSILIGEVVVGAILIIAQSFSLEIGKVMGTFALCALVLFIGVDNFTKMERGNKTVQGFALASLILNMVWLLLAILLIWELIPFAECVNTSYYGRMIRYSYCSYQITVAARIFLFALNTAISFFFISNVWAIEETVKPVKPLKITALVCELYCAIYAAIITLTLNADTYIDARWSMLSSLAGFAFIVMALAALAISRSGKKKNNEKAGAGLSGEEMNVKIQELVEKEVQARVGAEKTEEKPVTKTDEELRREIEEKLRREQIEKEVRAEMEKEKTEKKED